VPPGAYTVKLTADGKTQTQTFEVKKDPRLSTTQEEYTKQVTLALQIRDKLTDTNEGVIKIREIRKQLEDYTHRDDKRVADAAKALTQKLTAVEEELYQTKNRASEDPLNFPIKLNNKLAYVMGVVESSDTPPTQQSYMVYEEMASKTNAEIKSLNTVLTTDLAAFNKLIHDQNVPAVVAK
jgi:DNA-binding transcriptional MerR regulator